MRTLLPLLVAAVLAAPAAAYADWGAPRAVTPAGADSYAMGLAAVGDQPAVLAAVRGQGGTRLRLTRGGSTTDVVRSRNSFFRGAMFAGRGGDLVAGWLEIVNGSRRPVVATGARLQHRQLLAPGPRSTQHLDIAANRRGDAVAAFWRYDGQGYAVWASYRRAGERFGAPQQIATGRPDDPSVAIDQDGRAVVAWTAREAVHVASRTRGGSGFVADGQIAARPGGTADVAIDAGRTVVAWTSGNKSGSVLAATRNRGASFLAPVDVSGPLARFPHWMTPSVAMDHGLARVAWVQGIEHTVSRDRAALAAETSPGTWSTPRMRAVRSPAHVYWADLFGPAPGRPPMLVLTVARRFRFSVVTASLRSDGALGPSRAPAVGSNAGRALIAHGSRHSFLAAQRGGQVVVLRST